MTDLEKLLERVETQAEMIQVWSPLIDELTGALKELLAAVDEIEDGSTVPEWLRLRQAGFRAATVLGMKQRVCGHQRRRPVGPTYQEQAYLRCEDCGSEWSPEKGWSGVEVVP